MTSSQQEILNLTMATANTRNIKQISHVRDIVLNGRISPEVQSRLVKDILKFLLYHRDQIPLPYDQLKYYFEKQENIKKGSEASKLSQLLDAVQDFCDNLDVIFSQSVSVESLWILIGPTVATPKEVFQIQFSNHSVSEPLSTIPSTKLCSRLLHKSLVTYNALIDTNPPPITSLHILFQGQRSSNIQWFKPKHSFKVPKRGQSFTFHILSSNELSMVEDHQEASNMAKEKDPQLYQREDLNRIGNNTSDYSREEELIWYAAPKAIKGVRDTVLCIPKQGETWVQ